MAKITNFVAILRNIVVQRVRHWLLRCRGVHIAPTAVVKGNCQIDGEVRIGLETIVQSSFLDGRGGLVIGAHVLLDQCTVLTAQHNIDDPTYSTTFGPVEIEDYVVVFQGALILPGRRIGRGAIIGARSVVTNDIPPMSVAVGNPARIIRLRKSIHDHCDMQAMAGLNLLEKLKQHLGRTRGVQ